MTQITLGINNCFAGKRWPEPAVWAGIVADRLGLREVQFSLDLLDPRTQEPARAGQVQQIRAAAHAHGLTVASVFTGLAAYSTSLLLHPDQAMRADSLAWYRQALRLAGELGATATGGHLGALSTRDAADPARRATLAASLRAALHELAGVAKQAGQTCLLWEPMPVAREQPSTIDDALRLHEWINRDSPLPILYCIDLGHACAYDNRGVDRDPYAWVRRLGKLSPMIHLQQTDGKADHHWPFTRAYNAAGIIEGRRLVEAVHDAGAEAVSLTLEVIHPFEAREAQVLDDLKETVDYWRAALA